MKVRRQHLIVARRCTDCAVPLVGEETQIACPECLEKRRTNSQAYYLKHKKQRKQYEVAYRRSHQES